MSKNSKQRAISLHRLYNKLWDLFDATGMWLRDVYFDNGKAFCLTADGNSDLYVTAFVMNGEDISLSEPQRVTEAFTPVTETQRSAISITRMADGSERWFAIAATATINRVGEIDSMELFDDFVERFTGEDEFLTIYHADEALEIGCIDFVHREGAILLLSGTFDTEGANRELAQAMVDELNRSGQDWGGSIGYRAFAEPELETFVFQERDGDTLYTVNIPVYKKGKLREFSLLLERDAANLFTQIIRTEVVNPMSQALQDALKRLFPDDPDKVQQYVGRVEETKRSLNGEIVRDNLESAATKTDTQTKVEELAEELEVVLDDEAIGAIVESPVFQTSLSSIIAQAVKEAFASNNPNTALAEMRTLVDAVVDRVGELERDDSERLEEKLNDVPSKRTMRLTTKTTRPRQQDPDSDEADIPLADRAKSTLERIPGKK